jgi:hypothetical protein
MRTVFLYISDWGVRRVSTTERRVLEALAEAASSSGPNDVLPLRRIATEALDGDDQLAARILEALDLDGCIRTDRMGWYEGWLTEKGRAQAARGPKPPSKNPTSASL